MLKELQIRSANGISNGAPVSSLFPNYVAKFSFPRDLVSFDLQYESVLFTTGLPRGCGKFLEVLPDVNMDVFTALIWMGSSLLGGVKSEHCLSRFILCVQWMS